MNTECPMCGESHLKETFEGQTFIKGGKKYPFKYHFSKCTECGAEVNLAHHSKRNRAAMIEGECPTAAELVQWRQKWGLPQVVAGNMCGVGPTAFSKYERSRMSPSAPTVRLLQLLLASDDAMRVFVKINDVHTRTSTSFFDIVVEASCTHGNDVANYAAVDLKASMRDITRITSNGGDSSASNYSIKFSAREMSS